MRQCLEVKAVGKFPACRGLGALNSDSFSYCPHSEPFLLSQSLLDRPRRLFLESPGRSWFHPLYRKDLEGNGKTAFVKAILREGK